MNSYSNTNPYIFSKLRGARTWLTLAASASRLFGMSPDHTISKDDAGQAVRFKILSDRNRIRILQLLKEGPRTVTAIVDALCIERTLVSHHLKILRDNEMVVAEKTGRNVHYRIHKSLLSPGSRNSFNFGCCVISFPDEGKK